MKNILLPLLVLLICSCERTIAQEKATTDFFKEISQYDMSLVWTADKYYGVWLEGEEWVGRGFLFGFIGDDYQRFYIHVISAIKIPGKENEYQLYGKTRVKNNICEFQGIATIVDAKVTRSDVVRGYYSGYALSDIVLYEDNKQLSTGVIRGKMTSYFMLNSKGFFGYNGLHYISDNFTNNQFKGTWTSYKTGQSKRCHWGDYRIPDSGDLDIGAGEFSVNEIYRNSGWDSCYNMFMNDAETDAGKKARLEEDRQWWKE